MSKMENLSGNSDVTYNFTVEWFDNRSNIPRAFNLAYYSLDGTVELFDLKTKRIFLKRCIYPDVVLQDLFVGANVTVYARQLRVLDYGDSFTREKLSFVTQRTVAVLMPGHMKSLGVLMADLQAAQVAVSRLTSLSMTHRQALEFLDGTQASRLSEALASGPLVAIEVVGHNANEVVSREGVFVTQEDRASKYLFENQELVHKISDEECTVLVVKPHVWQAGYAGDVLLRVQQEGMEVCACRLLSFDRNMAVEFMDVYQGVVSDFAKVVDELTKGPSLVLQLTGPNVLNRLRALCGPLDPEIACHLRPDTLRAQYGQDRVRNAVHCTDLPEDGPLESAFFFETVRKVEAVKGNYYA